MVAEMRVMQDHQPLTSGSIWKLEKTRKWILFWSLQKEPALPPIPIPDSDLQNSNKCFKVMSLRTSLVVKWLEIAC